MLTRAELVDGLHLARGLAREGFFLVLERIAGAEGVPARVHEIGPAWLTVILQQQFAGIHIDAVRRLGGTAGTTDRVRLALQYKARGSGPAPPASLFVKTSPSTSRTRLFINLMHLGANEVGFYREIAKEVPVEHPRCFYAQVTDGSQRFVLVLEDLVDRHARFTDVSHPLDLADVRAVVQTLATLHAAWWESPRFHGDLVWLKAFERNPNQRTERFLCRAAVPQGLRAFPDLVPQVVTNALPLLLAARDQLEIEWARGPRTLIHGDAHVGNMYFLDGTVGLLDWQVVQYGQGMRDLSYFLVNSVPTELRRSEQRALIELYLETLGVFGVETPTFDDAWQQYRLHAIYAWISAAFTAAAATLQSAAIVRAGLERSCAALVDLESIEAVRRL